MWKNEGVWMGNSQGTLSIYLSIYLSSSLSIFHSYCMGKTHFFLFYWAFFDHAVELHVHWFVQCYKKTNQWLGGGIERVYGYAARQNGRGLWLYIRPLRHRISDFFSSATKSLPRWLFADAVETPQQLDWTSCSTQLSDPVYPCRHPTTI